MAGLAVRVSAMWNRSLGRGARIAVVVSVSENDGTAVSGLSADAFDVYVISAPDWIDTADKGGFYEYQAPPGGLYSMGTGDPPRPGNEWGSDQVTIVAHVKSGADEGRGLTTVILG